MITLQERLRDPSHGFDRNESHSEDRYVCLCDHLANEAADALDAKDARITELTAKLNSYPAKEEILSQALTGLAIQLSEETVPWTLAMHDTFITAYSHIKDLTPFPYSFIWRCVYCTKEHSSFNTRGTDIVCCGEVGHAALYLEPNQ